MRVRRAGEHADVGAGAEHLVLAGLEYDDLHFRVLEAQALQRIGEFDVDAEVVGVELELVALKQRRILVDVHDQVGDFAVELELPVLVSLRGTIEVDDARSGGQLGCVLVCHLWFSRNWLPIVVGCVLVQHFSSVNS